MLMYVEKKQNDAIVSAGLLLVELWRNIPLSYYNAIIM